MRFSHFWLAKTLPAIKRRELPCINSGTYELSVEYMSYAIIIMRMLTIGENWHNQSIGGAANGMHGTGVLKKWPFTKPNNWRLFKCLYIHTTLSNM